MLRQRLLVGIFLLLASFAANAAWYEGGNLHDATALEWQEAGYSNKLATCADLLAAAYQRDKLASVVTSQVSTVDDFKPLADTLVSEINAAFKPDPDPAKNRQMFASQKVAAAAAMIMIMKGWIELN